MQTGVKLKDRSRYAMLTLLKTKLELLPCNKIILSNKGEGALYMQNSSESQTNDAEWEKPDSSPQRRHTIKFQFQF